MKTNRREFIKGVFGDGAKLYLALAGLPLISACGSKERTINTNGVQYHIQNGVLTQANQGDGKIKLGVMADLHAYRQNSQYFADQLNKKGVDAYILAGDLSYWGGNDVPEILRVVKPVAETGKLVLTIPGNHETKKDYKKAMKELESKYPNVVDMEQTPVADLDDVTIVGFGGIGFNNEDAKKFCIDGGYLRRDSDFKKLRRLAKEHQGDKPLLIATHTPKKYSTRNGLDVITSGRNVGSNALARIREAIGSKFAVSGHIHEAPGIITPDGQTIKEGELSDKLDFNPGAVYDHKHGLRPAAGIMEFVGEEARAYILKK